jgi:hypothetical protein
MPLISITRLRIRSWRYLPGFIFYAFRSSHQAKSANGSLAVSVLQEARLTFWTQTAWTSEQAMKAFVISGAHGKVMRRLLHWCDEASMVHWTQESAQLLSWQEAHRRMQESGRASKVHHPSQDQLAYRIPEPVVGRGEARLK